MTSGEIDRLQRAALAIETDGVHGINTVKMMVGEPVAMALLVSHLRHSAGSMTGHPTGIDIAAQVKATLHQEGLIGG